MLKDLRLWQYVVIGGVGLGSLAILLSVYSGYEALTGWLGHDAAPAWVQAIGSILAVLIAIWISERQAKRTEISRALDRAGRYGELYGPAIALIGQSIARLNDAFFSALNSKESEFGVDPSFYQSRKLLQTAFETIPVHGMPTADSATAILRVRELFEESERQMEFLGDKFDRFLGISQGDIDSFDEKMSDWSAQLEILKADLIKMTMVE